MSAREAKKQRAPLVEVLFTDPWRKLLALGLAILLWMFLNSRIVREDVLDFSLVAVDVAAGPEREDDARLTLAVRLSLRDWHVRGFYSRVDNRMVDTVQLRFEGPRFLIDRLRQQNTRFEARPSPDSFTEKSCEFDIRHVQASEAQLQDLLVRMEPRIVRVELEKNERAEIPVKREHVEVVLPESDPEFAKRLENATIEFHPRTVALFGPSDAVRTLMETPKLFQVDLSGDALTRETELMRPLKLLHRHQVMRIRVEDPQPFVTYHLPPQWRTFTLTVPVRPWPIGMPGTVPDQYVLEPASAVIQFRATRTLENELLVLQESRRLDTWALENLLLLVRIRPNAESMEWLDTPDLFFRNSSLKQGVDWEVESLPAIKITRKQ